MLPESSVLQHLYVLYWRHLGINLQLPILIIGGAMQLISDFKFELCGCFLKSKVLNTDCICTWELTFYQVHNTRARMLMTSNPQSSEMAGQGETTYRSTSEMERMKIYYMAVQSCSNFHLKLNFQLHCKILFL